MGGLVGDGKSNTCTAITGDSGGYDYGDGSDDDVTISGATSLTGPKHYNNLTINTGIVLKAKNYPVRVKGTLTAGSGARIECTGDTNALGVAYYGTGGVGGIGGHFENDAYVAATFGASVNGWGGAGGGGGSSTNNGAPGTGGTTVGTYAAAAYEGDDAISLQLGLIRTATGGFISAQGGGGGSGGGGTNIGNPGGNGGQGGGICVVMARNIVVTSGTFEIQAKGEAGYQGDTNSGGGGGGGGGLAAVMYGTLSGTLALSAAGGAGGLKGTGGVTNGDAGSAGRTVTLAETQVTYNPAIGGLIGAGVEMDSVNTAAPDFGSQDYGDGRDVSLTSSGTTTLTKPTYYVNITLTGSGILDTAGYPCYVNGTCNVGASAKIRCNGNAASGDVGGVASASGSFGGGSAGTTGSGGGAGSAGDTRSNSYGGAGGAGGAGVGGAGGAAGTATAPVETTYPRRGMFPFAVMGYVNAAGGGANATVGGCGGASGGGFVSAGGGGGGGGGAVVLFARTLVLDGTIEAKGGDGGSGNFGSSGGGGGGGGGYIHLGYHVKSGSGSLVVTGGAGGTSVSATAGSAGSSGTTLEIQD